MRATWYVTEAGTPVDPAECSRKNGVLTHKSGAKIAMRFPDCPRSTGVDLDDKGKLVGGKSTAQPVVKEPAADPDGKPAADAAPPVKTEDMKPEAKPTPKKRAPYKTRGK